jgi:4-amino-4-deoxy-L-arabinose transferase-like glycosyltransferase
MSGSWTVRRWTRSCLAMVLVAWAIRLAVVPFTLPDRLEPARDHWRFAGETGRIARSIVAGEGFSSPLFAETGPTAWMTPVYPCIVAGVFRIFGVYTKASAIVMLVLDCLFSALTCIPVLLIARKSFGESTAIWAGWTWALFPYAIYFSADFIWATTLTTLLLAVLFLYALYVEDTSRTAVWLGFGIACGLGAMTDPTMLSVLIPVAAWMAYRRHQRGHPWLAPGTAATLAFLVFVSPWFIRNYHDFHTFVPFRDNLGLELYVGNNGDLSHFAPSGHHPSDTDREWKEFQERGEIDYMKHKKQQALDFIRAHPGWFMWATTRRALYMWTSFWSFDRHYLEQEPTDPPNVFLCTLLTVLALAGLWRAFRARSSLAMPYAIALFCFPLVYYFTHEEDYYRRPIDPIFVLLAVYAVTSWKASKRADKETLAVVYHS